jgi:T5orf172 domain
MISTRTPIPSTQQKRDPVPGRHLYIIQSDRTGAVKIGRSSDPEKRLLSLQTGSPHKLRLLASFEGRGDEEKALHRLVRKFRYRVEKGEWFHYDCLPELPDWVYEKLPFEDRWWEVQAARPRA